MAFNQQNNELISLIHEVIEIEEYEIYTEVEFNVIINTSSTTVDYDIQSDQEVNIQRKTLIPEDQETDTSIVITNNMNESTDEIIPAVSIEEPVINSSNSNNKNNEAQISKDNTSRMENEDVWLYEKTTENPKHSVDIETEISTNIAKDISPIGISAKSTLDLSKNVFKVKKESSPVKTTESVFLKHTFPDEEMYLHWKQNEAVLEGENNSHVGGMHKRKVEQNAADEASASAKKCTSKKFILNERLVYIHTEDPPVSHIPEKNLPSKNNLDCYKYNEVYHPWNIVKRNKEKQFRKPKNVPPTPVPSKTSSGKSILKRLLSGVPRTDILQLPYSNRHLQTDNKSGLIKKQLNFPEHEEGQESTSKLQATSSSGLKGKPRQLSKHVMLKSVRDYDEEHYIINKYEESKSKTKSLKNLVVTECNLRIQGLGAVAVTYFGTNEKK